VIRLSLLLLLIAHPVLAETWSGSAHVVDGDTIYVDQTRLRLLSMDAFESAQTCLRDGHEYPCGVEATRALIGLIGDRKVRCVGDRRDRYRRPLVVCRIGDLDLGREMVRLGWALSEYGTEYRADQNSAQAARVGAWAGTFTRPREWRRQKLNDPPK
jgi:endonuclease YncB( thermonuclease family)